MFLDSDDWVDVRLVETARAVIGSNHVGGLIDSGFATDFRNLRNVVIPHPAIFNGEFHRLCGSSTVARLRPEDPDPPRVIPIKYFTSTTAGLRSLASMVMRLPVSGNYVINTTQNHSEIHGPFAPCDAALRGASVAKGSRWTTLS